MNYNLKYVTVQLSKMKAKKLEESTESFPVTQIVTVWLSASKTGITCNTSVILSKEALNTGFICNTLVISSFS